MGLVKVQFAEITDEDREWLKKANFKPEVLDGKIKVTVTDKKKHSAFCYMRKEHIDMLSEDYIREHAELRYDKFLERYSVNISENDYYNDKERNPEKTIQVCYIGKEEGTGREVYQGSDDRYFLRECSSRENFAKWYVCGKRRKFEDGDEPRANLIFEYNGQREKVRYDDWNGVAAYSDTFNPDFNPETKRDKT